MVTRLEDAVVGEVFLWTENDADEGRVWYWTYICRDDMTLAYKIPVDNGKNDVYRRCLENIDSDMCDMEIQNWQDGS